MSPNPWVWDNFPFICVFVNIFQQCFMFFTVQVFVSLLKSFLFYSWYYYKWNYLISFLYCSLLVYKNAIFDICMFRIFEIWLSYEIWFVFLIQFFFKELWEAIPTLDLWNREKNQEFNHISKIWVSQWKLKPWKSLLAGSGVLEQMAVKKSKK